MHDGEMISWLETESGDRISIRGLCTFGRSKGNTVVLPTPKASRRHALVHEQGGEFWLVDLGSTNGIEINGQRVVHPVKLQPGDRIQMPDASFTLKESIEPVQVASLAQQREMTPYDLTIPEIRSVDCWLLLADLQGFTRLSQQMPATSLAPLVGRWMVDCQDILHRQNGILAKFLGDGFLAYWSGGDDVTGLIAATCGEFMAQQKTAPLPFRTVWHYGDVSFGGRAADSINAMIGPELNFAFRLEKVASRLRLNSIFSEPAAIRLGAHLPLASCGRQQIPDFEPERECFTLTDHGVGGATLLGGV